MSWYVYMLECGDGSIYTGITTDVEARLRCHNAGEGSKYVRSRGGARLRFTERHRTKRAAGARERTIKAWSRNEKLALILES